ncbi:hypothetical protein M378DRAFT_86868 [Amanita muscaria Koide BX008]|uniref:Uncharacterized protein n=1 Tax=Amanita muscaria (strain Koide BX008) TaxID=946122 RepID=A0A0C2WNA5_AMAMK|nr:hypothetical protein M378DRAFT_90659 [Amanita muscaria Koide BX008]KIL58191.1 hypothetical protein M378DRAFT_86868 [Amanita muscaria Koide BX008]
MVEEREGRIKVLDIKGICHDEIDTLERQLDATGLTRCWSIERVSFCACVLFVFLL